MLTKTRSDFWKCRASIQIEEKCYEQCARINASGHSCKCGNFSSTTDSPATNVEVLIAWLSADDERRKEIEIASRPTGNYAERYRVFFMDEYGMLNNTDLTEVIDSDVALEEDDLLWFELEPIE